MKSFMNCNGILFSILVFNSVCATYGQELCNSFELKEKEPIQNDILMHTSNKCSSTRNTEGLLSRKKRALSFPDGSSFVITASLVKAILLGIPLGWNVALEIDVFYKTPSLAELIKMKKAPFFRLHHRQRRDVWGNFEEVLNLYGIKGQPCILRTICEAQQYLAPKDTLLVHDVLKLIFSAPSVGGPDDVYTSAHTETDCKIYEKECPFSLLQLILSYEKL